MTRCQTLCVCVGGGGGGVGGGGGLGGGGGYGLRCSLRSARPYHQQDLI